MASSQLRTIDRNGRSRANMLEGNRAIMWETLDWTETASWCVGVSLSRFHSLSRLGLIFPARSCSSSSLQESINSPVRAADVTALHQHGSPAPLGLVQILSGTHKTDMSGEYLQWQLTAEEEPSLTLLVASSYWSHKAKMQNPQKYSINWSHRNFKMGFDCMELWKTDL